MTQEEKDLQTLSHNSAFWRFLQGTAANREAAIAKLRDAPDDAAVHKLAGEITAYTDILATYEWDKVLVRMVHAES